jgi:hypothetical protein
LEAHGENQLIFLITEGSNKSILHSIASALTPGITIGA